MKRFYTLTIAAAAAALTMTGQSKFDQSASLLVQSANLQQKAARVAAINSGDAPMRIFNPLQIDRFEQQLVAIVLDSAESASQLEERGFSIEPTGGKVVMAYLTPAQMEEAAEMECVKHISLGTEAVPMMSVARADNNIDVLHTGTETNYTPYNGQGVLCGIMDTGLQPNHVNFLKDGASRIERLWVITTGGTTQDFDTPAKIKNYTTDSSDDTHATHVLGIMAGSYNGKPGTNGKVALYNPTTGKQMVSSTRDIPYYGVATEANLAVAIGSLQNNNIVIAAQKLRDYARETGRPAVLNLSLGHNNGPHDGTAAQNLALAEIGKDILICISAGNEGDYDISLRKQFTSDASVSTCVSKSKSANGYVDIWGDNASPLTLEIKAVNKTTGAATSVLTLNTNTNGKAEFYGGSDYTNYTNVTVDPKINANFGEKALIQVSSNVSSTNNRYNVYVNFQVPGVNNDVVPAITVSGRAGSGVNMFCGSQGALQFTSNGLAGYENGTPDNSINDLACGDNVLCVGAFVNASKYPAIAGELTMGNYPAGDIAYFSSYGETFGGKKLPDVCGPGMGMISSYSRYYMEKDANKQDYNYRVAQVNAGKVSGKDVFDYYAEMSGTSMSSPFVAGVMALWLQADPNLTMDEVKSVIKETAIHNSFTEKAPERWGMGRIAPLAGLKKVLDMGGIDAVGADDPAEKLIIEALGGKQFNLFVANMDGFKANLYNMQGAQMASVAASGDSATLDASALEAGIYLLEITGNGLHTSQKLVIK